MIQTRSYRLYFNLPDFKIYTLFDLRYFIIFVCLVVLLPISLRLTAQTADSTARTKMFTGVVTVTTKGLSTFPNLTLGKPAAIFDLSMGGMKLRFEPQLRFSLEGYPWTFLFWFRYEVMNNKKLQFKIGAHPAYSFRKILVTEKGTEKEVLRAQQYLAGELTAFYKAGKNILIGPHYIHSRGLEKDIVQHSNFISFRATFTNIKLTENFYMRWMMQAYYLKMDANDGFYINSTLSANRYNFPFSVSSTVNKTIKSTITGKNFLWNLNLSYAFGAKYKKI